jgi:hypothetical protein
VGKDCNKWNKQTKIEFDHGMSPTENHTNCSNTGAVIINFIEHIKKSEHDRRRIEEERFMKKVMSLSRFAPDI